MLRGLVAALLAAAATAAVAAAAVAPDTRRAGPGPWAAGEVVMGTLTAPPTPAFLARVRSGKLGGVLLLGSWPSATAVRRVTAQLQEAACVRGEPLLVAVDQEGGIVKRFPWAAPNLAPAKLGDAARAGSEAAAAAGALQAVGVDVDFAPVVDTPSSARSFLGSRAFSRSAKTNAQLARAFVAGIQTSGAVAATAKHFPGLGEAGANTDLSTVVVHAKRWKLNRGLVPFRAAVSRGVDLVMVSSAAYPAFDPSGLPAVFSKTIETTLLRDGLGFDGVAVTDALDAPAGRIPHAATKAVAAGADLLVFGSERSAEQAFATLAADAKAYPHLRARLAEAGARIRALKMRLAAGGGPSCP